MPVSLLLRCNDLGSTKRYYQETLGFSVRDTLDSTVTVSLQDCSLTFTQQDLWASPVVASGTVYCAIADVDHYYAAIKDKADIAWPLQQMSYGSWEFGVRDCNGYYLAFTQHNTPGAN